MASVVKICQFTKFSFWKYDSGLGAAYSVSCHLQPLVICMCKATAQ